MAIRTNLPSLTPARERLKKTSKLLSGGYSNPTAFKDGLITVYPWDSTTSEWLVAQKNQNVTTSRDLVCRLTGLSTEVVNTMVESELNIVITVARSLAYKDQTISYHPVCPHCGTRQAPAQIKVPDELGKRGVKPDDYAGYDVATLPSCGDKLALRPLLVQDIVTLESRERPAGVSETVAQLVSALVMVNDSKPDSLEEAIRYFQALDPADVEYAASFLSDHAPQLDARVPHQCDNAKCGREFRHDLDLNLDFFRSGGAR